MKHVVPNSQATGQASGCSSALRATGAQAITAQTIDTDTSALIRSVRSDEGARDKVWSESESFIPDFPKTLADTGTP